MGWLVGAGEDGALPRRLAAMDANAAAAARASAENLGGIQRNAAHGRASLFLDFFFAIAAAAPGGIGEASLHGLLEVIVVRGRVRVGPSKCQRLVKDGLVNFHEELLDGH